MQRIAMLLASLLALLASTGVLAKAVGPSDKLESVLLMRVNGSITLGPDGKPVDFAFKTPLIPTIRDSLDRAVRQWQFKPVVIGGTPQQVSSDMRLVLGARKDGDDYRYTIDNVLFMGAHATRADPDAAVIPPIRLGTAHPPSYPVNNWPVTGKVLLAICVGPDGKAEQVEAVQAMLSNVKGSNSVLLKVVKAFESVAIDASKGWTFVISPDRARKSEHDRTGYVTVNFIGGDRKDFDKVGIWNTVVRTPRRPISWLQNEGSDGETLGVADLANGEMRSTDGAIKFAAPVVGTELQ